MFLKKKFGAWFSGCFSDTCQCEVKKIFTAKKSEGLSDKFTASR